MTTWYGTPTFTHGQVLSANAHLNALATCIQQLNDLALGNDVPFSGHVLGHADTDELLQVANAWLLHQNDLFMVCLTIPAGARVQVAINAATIYDHTAGGTDEFVDTTLDISGLALTVATFVEVQLLTTARGGLLPWALGETTADDLFPTFNPATDFVDESVPTAAQWQALSTYVDNLHRRIVFPRPVQTMAHVAHDAGAWCARFRRTGRYLLYRVRLEPPWEHGAGEDSDRATYCTLRVGRSPATLVTVKRLRVGHCHATMEAYDWDGGSTLYDFWGALDNGQAVDLDAYGFTAAEELYLQIDTTVSTPQDGGEAWLRYALVVTGGTPALPGWQALPTWTPVTDYVRGDTAGQAKTVWKLLTDLAILRANSSSRNYPCRVALPDDAYLIDEHWMVRTARWLHYTNQHGINPMLYYWGNEVNWEGTPVETAIALPDAAIHGALNFAAYDLNLADGLYPGTLYRLEGVTVAVEAEEGGA
jgi:hypothetical protein